MNKQNKKTWKYLVPAFGLINDENEKNLIRKYVVSAKDVFYTDEVFGTDNCVLLLFDDIFDIDDIKQSSTFKYAVPVDNVNMHSRMIIALKVPHAERIWANFRRGRYSKMYTEEEIDKLFVNDILNVRPVLLKHHSAYLDYKDKVFKEWGVKLEADFDGEYDFPPDENEMFKP